MNRVSRRHLLKSTAAAAALSEVLPALALGQASPANRRTLAQTGWCWDGQGFNGGVNPSIFGTGEGARWFGLRHECYMFHPNVPLALEKLRDFDSVVCEISKWRVRRCENGVAHTLDGTIESKTREAAAVSEMSRNFPNIKGAIDDDLLGIIKRENITPEQYAAVYRALKKDNPNLRLWIVVYTKELNKEVWEGFQPFVDVISLWEWDARNIPEFPDRLEECRKIFPKKPINVGCYLRDFPSLSGMPLDRLQMQWEQVRKWTADGTIEGYSILGGFLIDMHPEQAAWVRRFIAES
jgi:hypothetical protein